MLGKKHPILFFKQSFTGRNIPPVPTTGLEDWERAGFPNKWSHTKSNRNCCATIISNLKCPEPVRRGQSTKNGLFQSSGATEAFYVKTQITKTFLPPLHCHVDSFWLPNSVHQDRVICLSCYVSTSIRKKKK